MKPNNKFVGQPRHALDVAFQKRVGKKLDALLNAQILDEQGNVIGTVQYADGNTVFKFKSADGTGSAVSAFAITELTGADFFTARKLSNFRLVAGVATADVGVDNFKIAKPPTIRRSVVSELIDSFTITYRDSGDPDIDNNRIANDGVKDESQCVYPRYVTMATLGFSGTTPTNAQCVIFASQTGPGVFDGGGAALEWIEILPARVWAKRFAP